MDAKQLGALTVSTLRGEDGHQRKEIEKLLEFLKDEPRPDVVNIPYTLLICLAKPLKQALKCPVVITLQGEDLFLDALTEPYRTEAMELVRRRWRTWICSSRSASTTRASCATTCEIPRSEDARRHAGREHHGPAPDHRTRHDPFTIGYFARIAPEKGLHNLADAYRMLRLEKACRHRDWSRPVTSCLNTPYLEGIAESLRAAGLGDEFVYRGTVDRAKKVQFFHDIDVLSVPSPYHEPKGLYLLEAMACGVPVVQPNHGAFPEIIARTGGGVLASRRRAPTWPTRCTMCGGIPRGRRRWARRGAEGVRRHYTVAHMAERVLQIYQEVVPT